MPPEAPSPPVDAGAPRVEVSRLKGGERTWKIVAPAGVSGDELTAAKEAAIKVDAELTVHYDGPQAT